MTALRADVEAAGQLARAAERLSRQEPAKYGLLATMLDALVPLRMHELKTRDKQELASLGRAQVDALASHGDALLYKVKGETALAFKALLTGIACAALVADGGITVLGLHWCALPHEHCPKTAPRQSKESAP